MSEDSSEVDVGKEDAIVYLGSDLLKRSIKKRKKRSNLAMYQSKQSLTKEIKSMRRRSSRRTLQMIKLHENSSTSAYSDNGDVETGNMDQVNDDNFSTTDVNEPNIGSAASHPNAMHTDVRSSIPFDSDAKDIYLDSCVNQLVHTSLLKSFLGMLNVHDCLTDFMLLIQLVVKGQLSVLNIPFLLLMDLAKFKSCRTTTQMRYRIYTRQFWEAVYRFGGGTMIRLFSGMKNFGHVCLKKCKKSLYDPFLADVNFAVPDVKRLAKAVGTLKTKITCGFIEESIAMIDKSKQYNMSIDAKKISPGLSEDEGDIYLFGLEGPPNLESQRKQLANESDFVKNIIRQEELNDSTLQVKSAELEETISLCSERVKKQRLTNVSQEKLKVSFQKAMQKDTSTVFKYTNAISAIEMFQILSHDLIQRILEQNKNMCSILAMIRGNYANFVHCESVNLKEQGNCMTLYPPEQIQLPADEELLPQYTKQGSELWLQLRKEAVLSSSTAYAGLGLDTYRKQKDIFNERVLGHSPPPITPEMQRMFDHGRTNEIHRFGTVAAVLIPAYFSSDKIIAQLGCLYLDGNNRKKLYVVSPDGFITDSSPVTTRMNKDGFTEDMSVEIKSPMGENKMTTPVHYAIPKYYIPQVLLQMRVLEVGKCLYISKSRSSIAVLIVTFDNNIWKQMWSMTKEMFDKVTLKKLVRCAAESKDLSSKLEVFVKNNCRFLCELPVSVTSEGSYGIGKSHTPFRKPEEKRSGRSQIGDIKVQLIHICRQILGLLHESFEMERKKATEILMIVLNDTDRIFDPDSFYALPIAFLLKGYSLDVCTMREIINIVLNRMQKEGIDVVTTSFDGQWTNVAIKNEANLPLTRLQLQKYVWNKLGKISKDNLLKRLTNWTSVRKEDLDECSRSEFITVSQMTFGNLHVTFGNNALGKRVLSARCLNGDCEFDNVMLRVCTPQPHIRPNLWFDDDNEGTNSSSKNEGEDLLQMRGASNLLTLLPREFLQSKTVQTAIQHETNMSGDDEWLPDIPNTEAIASTYTDGTISEVDEMGYRLTHVHPHFLEQILVGLCSERRGHRWMELSIQELYDQVFRNQQQIEKLTSYEMDVVDNVFFSYKGLHLFRRNDLKTKKVKILCKLFARKRDIHKDSLKNTKNVTLRKLCLEYIKDVDYPTNVIGVAMVNPMHTECKALWLRNATVPMRIGLPKSTTIHECYSYPEVNTQRNRIECKMLDPTHILTNIRTHICTRGYKKIKRQAFLRVSETDNNVLNRAYIVNMLDKQSVGIAMKFFSIDVQRILMMNNDVEESDFVGLVRQWYEAVDERGLQVVNRVTRMQNFFEYISSFTNFDEYPPPTRYVGGMPIVTYESILHNISSRLQLYGICKGNTYNHRSLSTLDIETEFSNLSRMEGSYNGCPKSTSLGTMLMRMVQMQQLQYNQDKIFSMHVSQKKKYPENELISTTDGNNTDEESSDDEYVQSHLQNGATPLVFQSHVFDRRFQRLHVKKRKNVEVTTGNKPLRRESSVRVNFKAYESKLKCTTRHGLKF